jgi:hypothetical protein
MTRVWIVLVIVQRIPADIITAEYYAERYQRRPPPTAMPVILATRTPGPGVVVVNPASVVIRSPTPRLLAYPCPTIRRDPGPITITIGGPVNVAVDGGRSRMPDPAVISRVSPVAIDIKIFTTPNVSIVILRVITQPLCQVTLAFLHPEIPRI